MRSRRVLVRAVWMYESEMRIPKRRRHHGTECSPDPTYVDDSRWHRWLSQGDNRPWIPRNQKKYKTRKVRTSPCNFVCQAPVIVPISLSHTILVLGLDMVPYMPGWGWWRPMRATAKVLAISCSSDWTDQDMWVICISRLAGQAFLFVCNRECFDCQCQQQQ